MREDVVHIHTFMEKVLYAATEYSNCLAKLHEAQLRLSNVMSREFPQLSYTLVQHDEMLQEHGPDRTKKGENESEEEVNSFGLLQKNFASLGNVFSDLSNSISMMHESLNISFIQPLHTFATRCGGDTALKTNNYKDTLVSLCTKYKLCQQVYEKHEKTYLLSEVKSIVRTTKDAATSMLDINHKNKVQHSFQKRLESKAIDVLCAMREREAVKYDIVNVLDSYEKNLKLVLNEGVLAALLSLRTTSKVNNEYLEPQGNWGDSLSLLVEKMSFTVDKKRESKAMNVKSDLIACIMAMEERCRVNCRQFRVMVGDTNNEDQRIGEVNRSSLQSLHDDYDIGNTATLSTSTSSQELSQEEFDVALAAAEAARAMSVNPPKHPKKSIASSVWQYMKGTPKGISSIGGNANGDVTEIAMDGYEGAISSPQGGEKAYASLGTFSPGMVENDLYGDHHTLKASPTDSPSRAFKNSNNININNNNNNNNNNSEIDTVARMEEYTKVFDRSELNQYYQPPTPRNYVPSVLQQDILNGDDAILKQGYLFVAIGRAKEQNNARAFNRSWIIVTKRKIMEIVIAKNREANDHKSTTAGSNGQNTIKDAMVQSDVRDLLLCGLRTPSESSNSNDISLSFSFEVNHASKGAMTYVCEGMSEYSEWLRAIQQGISSSLQSSTSNNPSISRYSVGVDVDRYDSRGEDGEVGERPLSIRGVAAYFSMCRCVDCGRQGPEWVAVNIGAVICIDCCGIHRSLGVQISKVRSLQLDSFDPLECEFLLAVNNHDNDQKDDDKGPMNVNQVFDSIEIDRSNARPIATSEYAVRAEYIHSKYVEKKWLTPLCVDSTTTDNNNDDYNHVNRLLFEAVSKDDAMKVIHCIVQGGDVNMIVPSAWIDVEREEQRDNNDNNDNNDGSEQDKVRTEIIDRPLLEYAVTHNKKLSVVALILNGADESTVGIDNYSSLSSLPSAGYNESRSISLVTAQIALKEGHTVVAEYLFNKASTKI